MTKKKIQNNTACECPLAGFCKRHDVEKTPDMHSLCQTNAGYFELWENCQGPGQNPYNCWEKEEAKKPEQTLPSIGAMASNLAKSTLTHLLSGMQTVSEEEQNARLDMCISCEYLIKESGRCSKCGCYMSTKTKWKTSACPIGKW